MFLSFQSPQKSVLRNNGVLQILKVNKNKNEYATFFTYDRKILVAGSDAHNGLFLVKVITAISIKADAPVWFWLINSHSGWVLLFSSLSPPFSPWITPHPAHTQSYEKETRPW